MQTQKSFGEYTYPAFRFGEPGEGLQWVKSVLMRGGSLEIVAVEMSNPPAFRVRTFDSAHWTYEELLSTVSEESALGLHRASCLPVTALGTPSFITDMINETLDAGFTTYLITESGKESGVMGYYTLVTNIADNS